MTSLITCDCFAFEIFFPLAIMADKQMFKVLVMVELLDSEEEETKGRGMKRSWLKKREKLGYLTNIVRELQYILFARLFLHFANPFCKTEETTDRTNCTFE